MSNIDMIAARDLCFFAWTRKEIKKKEVLLKRK